MRRVADHLSAILETIPEVDAIDIQLLDAHRCVAAEDVIAPWSLPPFDSAAVDGYAVRCSDLSDPPAEEDADAPGPDPGPQTPVEKWQQAQTADSEEPGEPTEDQPSTRVLPVVGEVRAGDLGATALGDRHAMRVRVGAQLPTGADAVVPVEHTDAGEVIVTVTADVTPGQHIRVAADDVAAGDIVMRAGTFLGAAQIGLLAAVGKDRVRVRPRPRVVIMSVGDELVEPGLPVAFGQVTDSNSYALTAAVEEAGAVAYRVPALPDDPRRLAAAVSDQLVRADLVLTSGGIGDQYEVMREVFSKIGDVTFHSIPMSPGPVQGLGLLGEERVPVLALPGDPASAFVAFEVFARPAIRRMLGVGKVHRTSVRARLTTPVHSAEGERWFMRATVAPTADGEHEVTPFEDQEAHHIAGLARANALVVVPEATTTLAPGDEVDCLLLERRRG